MKIILSRKGFDSSYGGVPSPILPDGTLLSIPIPSKRPPLRYCDLRLEGQHSFGKIVEDLARPNFTRKFGKFVHLDPDIRRTLRPRPRGWQPLFGPGGSARGHLRNQKVREDALFLFYGWFKKVKVEDGHYSYVKDATDIHVFFGWMQVGKVYDGQLPNWAKEFPHFGEGETVYTARTTLDLKGFRSRLRGAGVFTKYRDVLQLSERGKSRSIWKLPRWFYPFDPKHPRKPLTYHKGKGRWKIRNNHVRLDAARPGQEFVFDTAEYPEAYLWLKTLFAA
jgi:hypothetical protein